MQLISYCGNFGAAESVEVFGQDARKDFVLG